MATVSSISLTTPVEELKGVGPATARGLRSIGIRCAADLILHLPLRHERVLPETSIAETSDRVSPVHGSEAKVSVRGEILTVQTRRGRRSRVEATLHDGTATMLITWFNAQWMRHKVHPGMHIAATGKAKRYGDYLQIVNPTWRAIKPEGDDENGDVADGESFHAVYPANEQITSRQIRSVVERNLDGILAQLEDHLHEEYRGERALPELAQAYRMIHRPVDPDEVDYARRRLAFDELLLLQLAVMMKRLHRRSALQAIELHRSEAIHEHILERFPFELTTAQEKVIEEIVKDLERDVPANRLLQGDVGAGKTVVALYAMLLAVAHGHQAAVMAPTELLAEQHLQSITSMLSGSRVTIELLTGSLGAADRRDVIARIERGESDIVIGTHALLTGDVSFTSLAVCVIDEQHRFGVHQRATLRERSGELTPHTLVMTATPIPRTMSLTIFGDLDVSQIDALPPGRQPVTTRVVPPERSNDVYDHVAKQIRAGDQAFIVAPLIEETDSGLSNVEALHAFLRHGALRDARLAVMHGRLKRDEREAIMDAFRRHEIDALIATTVIEVGVDVPNATIMVIEQAERFGLSQLHQLRGRIGRGSKRSLCVLIADPTTEEGKQRIDAIGSTSDGFVIAEKDLEIRGPGEVFGTRQAGMAPFRAARLPEDLKLLERARRDAAAWIEEDPTLENPRDELLRKRLLKAHGALLQLGDVG